MSSRYERLNPRARAPKRPWTIHPIWRGIGCVMLILIPVMSYAGAVLLIEENGKQGWLPMPYEFSRAIYIPLIGNIPNLLANLLIAFVLSVVGFGVLTALYSIMFSISGAPKHGPLDAPPIYRDERLLDVWSKSPEYQRKKKKK